MNDLRVIEPLLKMAQIRASCPPWVKITRWKMTHEQALSLASDLASRTRSKSPSEVYDDLCSGQSRILGVPVNVQ